ncbi:MAG: FAD/FMN-containing dehydrogenase [Candidatus Poriferisodalaceae bacterium]|jgi:FAD/FMN-containing dehydrogenase
MSSARVTLASTDPVLDTFADDVGDSGPIAIEGGRSRWNFGGTLDASARIISAPVGIVEHIPEEMIVTVRCATTTAELGAALAAKGQRTGLPERGGTVGGSIVVGHNHLEVAGRGTLRSSVLQVRYVSAEGRIVTGGGPTVKNVTGFDLPRLMAGSLGALGCLAEVIIRTNPIPAVSQWFSATGADPLSVSRSVLAPSAVVWDGAMTRVLLEGHAADVAVQATALRAAGSFEECEPFVEPVGHRWSLTPSDVLDLDGPTIGSHDTGAFHALVGVGLVWAENPQPLRQLPAALQAVHDRVKAQFDPTGRLNPGRSPETS